MTPASRAPLCSFTGFSANTAPFIGLFSGTVWGHRGTFRHQAQKFTLPHMPSRLASPKPCTPARTGASVAIRKPS